MATRRALDELWRLSLVFQSFADLAEHAVLLDPALGIAAGDGHAHQGNLLAGAGVVAVELRALAFVFGGQDSSCLAPSRVSAR